MKRGGPIIFGKSYLKLPRGSQRNPKKAQDYRILPEFMWLSGLHTFANEAQA